VMGRNSFEGRIGILIRQGGFLGFEWVCSCPGSVVHFPILMRRVRVGIGGGLVRGGVGGGFPNADCGIRIADWERHWKTEKTQVGAGRYLGMWAQRVGEDLPPHPGPLPFGEREEEAGSKQVGLVLWGREARWDHWGWWGGSFGF
jgi:hypothetical protein